MAIGRTSGEDRARLREAADRLRAGALWSAKARAGRAENEQDRTWSAAGTRFAERAIAAQARGDDAAAADAVRRLLRLPDVQGGWASAGIVAVNHLLYQEVLVIDAAFERAVVRLDDALAQLDGLTGLAARELRHILASSTDYEIPRADLARIRAATDLEAKHDAPFGGERDPEALREPVLAVLRVVRTLRDTRSGTPAGTAG